MQCYCCQKFGHKKGSPKCQIKNNDKSICLYCAEEHASKNCTTKDKPTGYKCSNCSQSNNNAYKQSCRGHTSNSFTCPIVQHELKLLKSRTLGESEHSETAKNAVVT